MISPGESVQSVRVLQGVEQVFCFCWKNIKRLHYFKQKIVSQDMCALPQLEFTNRWKIDVKLFAAGICQRYHDRLAHQEYSKRMDFAGVLVAYLDPGTLHTSPPSLGTTIVGTGSFLNSRSLEQMLQMNTSGAHCWAHVHSDRGDTEIRWLECSQRSMTVWGVMAAFLVGWLV